MACSAVMAVGDQVPSAGYGVLFVLCLLIAASVWLGTVAQRVVRSGAFMKGYFLGNRGLGAWALALTATVQSGGTFMGFPALVYRNGWIVALWIAAYMVVPITGFGVLAKRFAQLSRRTGAITVPDMFRERFGNSTIGLVASLIILFSMTMMMVAQFKAGAIVMKIAIPNAKALTLDEGVDLNAFDDKYYAIGLGVFTATVVGYTLIGGFLAAVWTDLFQSLLMWVGIMILLPLSLFAVGGLNNASEHLRFELPIATAKIDELKEPTDTSQGGQGTADVQPDWRQQLRAQKEADFAQELAQLHALNAALRSAGDASQPLPDKSPISAGGEGSAIQYFGGGYKLHPPGSTQRDLLACSPPDEKGWRAVLYSNGLVKVDKFAGAPGDLSTGPGPLAAGGKHYLPLGLAFSFFFVWVFNGLGSPAGGVRLMACKDTATIRRSIFLLGTYNLFIYIPLILVCICARTLIPDLPVSKTDEIVPRMALGTTQHLTGGSLITGLILTAPFGAVMATVSSYLVVISSGVVRDIYQRFLNPQAQPHELKRLSYAVMMVVGAIGLGLNIYPIRFLQTLVVFSSSCAGTAFVVPYLMTAYWRRATALGAMSSMLAGMGTTLTLYLIGWKKYGTFVAYNLLGLDPIVWGLAISLGVGVLVSLVTTLPREEFIARAFDAEPTPLPETAASLG